MYYLLDLILCSHNPLLKKRITVTSESLLNPEWNRCRPGKVSQSHPRSLWDVASVSFAATAHLALLFLAVEHANATLYEVVPLFFQGQVFVLTFFFFANRCHFSAAPRDPHCLLWTANLTDHQSSNGLTSYTLNMGQNTVQRSDRNPHFLRYNISTQLICSSVQFIIFILADD